MIGTARHCPARFSRLLAGRSLAVKAAAKEIGIKMSLFERDYIYGAREITDSTCETYDINQKQFKRFAYLVGDYSTLLLFSDFAPISSIALDIESCAAFATFMCLEEGMKVKSSTKQHHSRKRTVAGSTHLQAFSTMINAACTWQANGATVTVSVVRYVSSIGRSMKTGPAAITVPACLFVPQWQSGKIRLSVHKYDQRIQKQMDHEPEGTGHCSLIDICQVQNFLCSLLNNTKALQTYVMILMSIHLFLKKGEPKTSVTSILLQTYTFCINMQNYT